MDIKEGVCRDFYEMRAAMMTPPGIIVKNWVPINEHIWSCFYPIIQGEIRDVQ